MFTRTTALLLAAVFVLASMAGTAAAGEDFPGSEDHPLVSRFPGSFIYSWEYRVFDALVVPTGTIVEEEQPDEGPLPDTAAAASRGRMYVPEDGIMAEGAVTQLTYVAPEGHSVLEVHRSYEQAFADAGFEILHSASGEGDIGPYEAWHITRYGAGPEHRGYLLRESVEEQYLAVRLERTEGDVYAALYVTYSEGGEFPGQPVTQLDIVEEETMEEGQIAAHPDYERTEPDIEPMAEEDYEGSSNHPVLSRFSGSFIYAQEHDAFDKYILPTGQIVEGDLPEDDEDMPD